MNPSTQLQASTRVEADAATFVSVVVPVRNEAMFIENTVRQLLEQAYDPSRYEILIVDGQSDDDTAEIVQRIARDEPRVRLLQNPRRLSSAARNIGVRAARGELIVIVDGHCQLQSDDYLHQVADAFARSGADCLGRPQPLDVTGATTLQRAIAAARSCWIGHHPASHIYSNTERFVPPQSVAVAYRRNVFDCVGFFDETFDACEDVEFNHRVHGADLKCFLTPKVSVHYHPRSSLRGLFRQMMRYGVGRMRLFRKHPDTFSWGSFAPAPFVLGLALGPLLFLGGTWASLLFVAPVALYLACVLTVSVSLAAWQRDLRLLPWLPLVFATVHIGAGVGILREFLRGLLPRRRTH